MVNGVTDKNYVNYTTFSSNQAEETTAANQANAAVANEADKDAFIPSEGDGSKETEKTYTYKKEIMDAVTAANDASVRAFKQMIRSLLKGQGMLSNYYDMDLTSEDGILKLKSMIDDGLEIDAGTASKAQELIDEGGAFSVEAVSDRLMNFAMAISGGDKSAYETLKKAIDQGFKEAAKLWGGELPEISQKTYEATMEKLDAWYNGE